VRQEVIKALSALFNYDTVDFAGRVTLSRVYAAINDTEGVDYGSVVTLDEAPSTPGVLADVQMSDLQIPSVGTVTVAASGGIV
jgi:uncharacterized phage protein gp47/JayE